eukprot:gnl/MRDRNA2_/MRDRNA2_102616_c0_seq1.p1 gnl/MRDRNA2_/MRDRNA2_102616_c0~~gnl/MRDRNA2_/MRDRNA2_102616_c0_seq1.p1  ORF type:complete len:280 (+),score=65.44 gnl/MRDRNA2_/MRDRNA2_102616_c0_seq1:76-915(+)
MFGSTPALGGYSQSQPDVPMDGTQGSSQKAPASGESILMPVTIHMLEKAVATQAHGGPSGDFKVDGRSANMLTIVAAVEELNRQQTSMEFVLNDSTGRMKARFFFPADLKVDNVQNGSYVSVTGFLKTQPATHFSVVALHPVRSADQISYHAIEVVYSSMRSKGKLNSSKESATKAQEFSLPAHQGVAAIPRPMVNSSGQHAADPMAARAAPAAADSGPLRDQVAAFISSKDNPEGVSFGELTAHFSTAASDAVRAAVTDLLDDGSAYTTIDDDHFASV